MADSPAGPGTEPSPAGEATHAESSQPSPEYMDLKHRVHRRLVERINLERLAEIDAPRVRREVREAVASLVAEEDAGLERDVGERLIEEVLNEVFGLGPLEPLMADPTISDILVTTPKLVHVERDGKLVKTPVRFKDNAHLQRIIQKIVSYTGRRIDESSPMVDARLPRWFSSQCRHPTNCRRRSASVDPSLLPGHLDCLRLDPQRDAKRRDARATGGVRPFTPQHSHCRGHGNGKNDAAERAFRIHRAR